MYALILRRMNYKHCERGLKMDPKLPALTNVSRDLNKIRRLAIIFQCYLAANVGQMVGSMLMKYCWLKKEYEQEMDLVPAA